MTLPTTFGSLINALIAEIATATGVDLTVFLPLWNGLNFSSPIAFFISLGESLIATGPALLGSTRPLNALNLFNLVPTDLLAHIQTSPTSARSSPTCSPTRLFQDVDGIRRRRDWIHRRRQADSADSARCRPSPTVPPTNCWAT